MEEKPDHLGHRERLRKRFHKGGDESLQDYELLELLLTYSIPRKDVKPYAKVLIKKFGSLAGALDASPQELEEALHIGPISSTLIRLVKRLCEAYFAEKMINRDALSSPQAVLDFARVKMAGLPHEGFMVVFLNTKNRVLDYEIIQEGTVDRAVIYPRRIIEEAISRHAASVILVHNHPSGHSEPSSEDRDLTRSIVEAARTIDLRVLDHVVVGKDGYFSFIENHIFPGVAR
jgi:DNA repair protein RadC